MSEISRILDWYDRNQKRGIDEALPANEPGWTRIIEQYNEEKRKNNTLAIEEIIPLAIRAMEIDPETRATWSSTRTRHLLVDEFQDVTPRQYQMLNLMTGPTRSILVAADPNQSINRWRGADPTLMEQFRLDHGGRLNTRMLRINHRGTEVLSGVAATLTRSGDMEGLNYDYQSAIRPDGEIPTLNRYETTPQEMDQHILNWAETLMREGHRWEDMAIIYRTHRTINRMMSQFSGRRIPYTILGNTQTDRNSNAECITAMLVPGAQPIRPEGLHDRRRWQPEQPSPRQLNRELTKMIHRDAVRSRTNMIKASEDYIRKLDPGAPSIRAAPVHQQRVEGAQPDAGHPGNVDLYDICRRANTLLLESQRASHGGTIQEPQTFRLMSLSQTTPQDGTGEHEGVHGPVPGADGIGAGARPPVGRERRPLRAQPGGDLRDHPPGQGDAVGDSLGGGRPRQRDAAGTPEGRVRTGHGGGGAGLLRGRDQGYQPAPFLLLHHQRSRAAAGTLPLPERA